MYQVSHFTCQTFCFTTRQLQLLSARIKVFDTWGISPLLPHLSTFSQQKRALIWGLVCNVSAAPPLWFQCSAYATLHQKLSVIRELKTH